MYSRKINILIVDDHTLVREGIRKLLELEEDLKIVAEGVNGEEAIKLATRFNPDVILLDINMPKMNGLESLGRMKDMGIKSRIIMVSAFSNKEYIIEATKIGAHGFILKDTNSRTLINAIRSINQGGTYLQPSLARILLQGNGEGELESRNLNKIDMLTKREYEILSLISLGNNNKEIGDFLFISEQTVKNHLSNIYKKLEVQDRVQAVIFAYENHMVKIIPS